MRLFVRLFVTSLVTVLAGCDVFSPTSPASPSPPLQPASFVLSGVVAENANGTSRPVADQFLALFIQETEGLPPGISLRGSVQYVTTDHDGRYTASVPRGRVFVSAVWGKQQPCVASASVNRDTVLDVEVFSGSSVAPPTAAGPMITGLVYETTPQGRKPLRSAAAWLDLFSDAYIAATVTDADGRFYFCRVNDSVRMDVDAEGYQAQSQFIQGAKDMFLEIELKRR
jgi:hypothetical protein